MPDIIKLICQRVIESICDTNFSYSFFPKIMYFLKWIFYIIYLYFYNKKKILYLEKDVKKIIKKFIYLLLYFFILKTDNTKYFNSFINCKLNLCYDILNEIL